MEFDGPHHQDAHSFGTKQDTFFQKVPSLETSGKPAFPVFSRGGAVGSLSSQDSKKEKGMRSQTGVGRRDQTQPKPPSFTHCV